MARKKEIDRFWEKVTKSETCWLWSAGLSYKGYGIFNIIDPSSSIGMRPVGAHRYSYMLRYGAIPEGKVIDHMCFVRNCVNPEHLRTLTKIENSLRENIKPVTHCKRNHEFTIENTKYHSKTKARVCAECMRVYSKAWMRKYRMNQKSGNYKCMVL
jgi:hypothetical protein